MGPFVKSSVCRSRECLFTHIVATDSTLDILCYFLWFASEVSWDQNKKLIIFLISSDQSVNL